MLDRQAFTYTYPWMLENERLKKVKFLELSPILTKQPHRNMQICFARKALT